MILTGGDNATVRLWSLATGSPLGAPCQHRAPISRVALSPDGKTAVTGCYDGRVFRWDATSGHSLGPPLSRHRDRIECLAFSRDGHSFLSASLDGTAQLWDTGTGMPLGSLIVHKGPITAAAFSPDGRCLVTASHDKTVRLWRLPDLLPDDLEWATTLVEATTGWQLDDQGSLRTIDRAAWIDRWTRLRRAGVQAPQPQPPREAPGGR